MNSVNQRDSFNVLIYKVIYSWETSNLIVERTVGALPSLVSRMLFCLAGMKMINEEETGCRSMETLSQLLNQVGMRVIRGKGL